MWRNTLIGTVSGIAAAVTLTFLDRQHVPTSSIRPGVVRTESDKSSLDGPLVTTGTTRSELVKALATPVSEINAKEIAFSEVINYLREVTGANFIVEWGRLESAGIRRDTQIQLILRNVSARTVLKAACELVAEQPRRVVFVMDEDMVRITLDNDAWRECTTRIYHVSDLVNREANRAQELRIFNAERNARNLSDVFGDVLPEPQTPLEFQEVAMVNLSRLIQQRVDPPGWVDNGGRNGTLSHVAGRIVITQTPRAHQEIEELLDLLRSEP